MPFKVFVFSCSNFSVTVRLLYLPIVFHVVCITNYIIDILSACLWYIIFTGAKSDADATAMKVQQVNQNRLPQMYRRRNCAKGDLQESKGFSIQPHILLLAILAALTFCILG